MDEEAVTPEVALAAEGDLRLIPALAPPSPPGHGHAPLDPIAVPAPTRDPGQKPFFIESSVNNLNWYKGKR